MTGFALSNILFAIYVPLIIISICTSWISSIPYQLWIPGKPGAIEGVLWILGILLFFLRYEEGKNSSCSFGIYVLVPAALIQFLPYLDSSLRVTYLDVGQGDSIVIELPHKDVRQFM